MNTTRNVPLSLQGINPAPQQLPSMLPLHQDWTASRQFLDNVICQVILNNAHQGVQHPMNYFVNIFTANGWNNEDMQKFTTLVYGYFSCVAADLPVVAPIMGNGNSINADQTTQTLFDFYLGYRFNQDVNTLLLQYGDIISRISNAVNAHYESLNSEAGNNAIAAYVASLNGQQFNQAPQQTMGVGVQLPGQTAQTQGVQLPGQQATMPNNTVVASGGGSYWDAIAGTQTAAQPAVQPTTPVVQPAVKSAAPTKPRPAPFTKDGRFNFEYDHIGIKTTLVNGVEINWGIKNYDDTDNFVVDLADPTILIDGEGEVSEIYTQYPAACATNRRRCDLEDHIEEFDIGYVETGVGLLTMEDFKPLEDLNEEYPSLSDLLQSEKELVAWAYKRLKARALELNLPAVLAEKYLANIDDLAAWIRNESDVVSHDVHLVPEMADFIGDVKVQSVHKELMTARATLLFKQYWQVFNCLDVPLNPYSNPWGTEQSQHELADKVFGSNWMEHLDLDYIHYTRLAGRDVLFFNAKEPVINAYIGKYLHDNPLAGRSPFVESNLTAKNSPDFYMLNSYDGDVYVERVYLNKGDDMDLARHFGDFKPKTPEIKEVKVEEVELPNYENQGTMVLATGNYGMSADPVEVLEQAETVARLTQAGEWYDVVSATFQAATTYIVFNDEVRAWHNQLAAQASTLSLEDVRHRILAAREDEAIDDGYLDMLDRLLVERVNNYANFNLAVNSVVMSKTFVEEIQPMVENILENLSPLEQKNFLALDQYELVKSVLQPISREQAGVMAKRLRDNLTDKFNGKGKLEISAVVPDSSVHVTQEALDDHLQSLSLEERATVMVEGAVDMDLVHENYLRKHGHIVRDRKEVGLRADNVIGFSEHSRVVRLMQTLDDLGLDKCYETQGAVRATFRFLDASTILPNTWVENKGGCAREFAVTKDGHLLELFRSNRDLTKVNLMVR